MSYQASGQQYDYPATTATSLISNLMNTRAQGPPFPGVKVFWQVDIQIKKSINHIHRVSDEAFIRVDVVHWDICSRICPTRIINY